MKLRNLMGALVALAGIVVTPSAAFAKGDIMDIRCVDQTGAMVFGTANQSDPFVCSPDHPLTIGDTLTIRVRMFTRNWEDVKGSKGANLPKILYCPLGRGYATVFSWAMVFLLLLCVTVFINVPAKIIDQQWLTQGAFFWPIVGVIFGYYVLATLFPIDTIIGRIYPFFSVMLLVGTLAILVKVLCDGFVDPSILEESVEFAKYKTEVFK